MTIEKQPPMTQLLTEINQMIPSNPSNPKSESSDSPHNPFQHQQKLKLQTQLNETLQELAQVKSTMEAQQKLVHDTIGHYMEMKELFEQKEKEWTDKLQACQDLLEQRNKQIEAQELKLQETLKQLDRVNAYVANNVINGNTVGPISTVNTGEVQTGVSSVSAGLAGGMGSGLANVLPSNLPSASVTPSTASLGNSVAATAQIPQVQQGSQASHAPQVGQVIQINQGAPAPTLANQPLNLSQQPAFIVNQISTLNPMNMPIINSQHLLSFTDRCGSPALESTVGDLMNGNTGFVGSASTSAAYQAIVAPVPYSSVPMMPSASNVPPSAVHPSMQSIFLPGRVTATVTASLPTSMSAMSSIGNVANVTNAGVAPSVPQVVQAPLSGHSSLSQPPISGHSPLSQTPISGHSSLSQTPLDLEGVVLNPTLPNQLLTASEQENQAPLEIKLELRAEPSVQDINQEPQTKKQKCSTAWSSTDTAALINAVKTHGDGDWDKIATLLGHTSGAECQKQYQESTKIRRGKWSSGEDDLLLQHHKKLLETDDPTVNSHQFWQVIAESMGNGRTSTQCMTRRGKWSEEEWELLRKGYEEHGRAWVKISENIPGRTQRQCRAQWIIMQRRLEREKQRKLESENPDKESTVKEEESSDYNDSDEVMSDFSDDEDVSLLLTSSVPASTNVSRSEQVSLDENAQN